MDANQKIIVVMPAYNAAKTLLATYENIDTGIVNEVILVDDASKDKTLEIAKTLHLKVIAHPHNVGYGGNQKTCYMEALRDGADIVIMLHPDGQYDPRLIPELIKPLQDNEADMVLGSRMMLKGKALEGGMPIYKYISNKFLTFCENVVLGLNMSEFHTGYRAYSRQFIETIPFLRNSNNFVFDTQVIVQAVALGLRIAEVPTTTKYFAGCSSASFSQSIRYGVGTLFVLIRYLLHKSGILRSQVFSK